MKKHLLEHVCCVLKFLWKEFQRCIYGVEYIELMKNIVRAGTLILFVTLISGFVAYKSGVFSPENQKKESPKTTSQQHLKPQATKNVSIDSPIIPVLDSLLLNDPNADGFIETNPLIFSSKSMIVNENWNEHAAAVAKIVRQMDSIKKLDSIQRAKEWETVSPR